MGVKAGALREQDTTGKDTEFREGRWVQGVLGPRGHGGKHIPGESPGKAEASVSESPQNLVRRWKPQVQGLREGMVMGLLRVRERLAPQRKAGAMTLSDISHGHPTQEEVSFHSQVSRSAQRGP